MNQLETNLNEKYKKYLEKYYENFPEAKRPGNRFLISKCPEKKEDVKILFLNLNPSSKDGNTDETFNTDKNFWFDEYWGPGEKDKIYFQRCLYWITERYENPEWSYKKQLENEHKKNDPYSGISTKNILCAYYGPLRTGKWEEIPNPLKDASYDLWKSILSGNKPLLAPEYIFTTGKVPYENICKILATDETSSCSGWPGYNFSKTDDTKIIGLPQLTRFKIFCQTEKHIELLEKEMKRKKIF